MRIHLPFQCSDHVSHRSNELSERRPTFRILNPISMCRTIPQFGFVSGCEQQGETTAPLFSPHPFPPHRPGYQAIFVRCGCSSCGYADCSPVHRFSAVTQGSAPPILAQIRHSNSHTSISPAYAHFQRTWAHQHQPLFNHLCLCLVE